MIVKAVVVEPAVFELLSLDCDLMGGVWHGQSLLACCSLPNSALFEKEQHFEGCVEEIISISMHIEGRV